MTDSQVVQSGGTAIGTVISGGTMDVQSGGSATGGITFSGTGGVLEIDGASLPTDPSQLLGGVIIAGLTPGNTIDLTGIALDNNGQANLLAGNELQITENGSSYDLQLDPSFNFAGDFFHLVPDAGAGTDITEDNVACYARGTLIRTDCGEVLVEDLAIGERVVTLSGEAKPIRWIGRRSYAGRFVAGNKDVLPICVKAGALADGVPVRDLWVSPEHALYLDEALVPARHLVNGRSIVQVEDVASVEYFHIELDSHDVIIAEGAFAESFVDDDSRMMFHNAPDYYALYPEAPARVAPIYCAPRIEDGFELEALRRRLAGRSIRLAAGAGSRIMGRLDLARCDLIEGWAYDPAAPDAAVTAVILANGAEIARLRADQYRADLAADAIGDGRHAFSYAVPGGLSADMAHEIVLCVAGDDAVLPGSPVIVPASRPAVPPPAPLGALHGNLDDVTRNRVAGWAQDEANGERPVGLLITANGQIIDRVLANRHRADLAASGLGSGRHAFDLALPATLPVLEDQEIRVVREADGAELPGSPVVLPAARGFDAPVQQGLSGLLAGIAAGADEEAALAFLTTETDRLLARRAVRSGGRAAREALRSHRRRWGGGAPVAPRSEGRRALVIDSAVPVASRDAGSVAILSHIRALTALGYQVSLAAAEEIGNTAGADTLAAEGIALCGAPYYSCVEDVLVRQAGAFDLVYLHRLTNAERYLALARRHQPTARLVYSVADLHHLRLQRQAHVEGRPELLALSRRVAAAELMAARRADLVITHSSVEADLLRRELGPARVHVVPFTVAQQRCRKPFSERHGIAFIGSQTHAPNPDAVHYLLREVMPLVWREDPAITCAIVGHGWSADRLPRVDERVTIAGAVDELATVFDTVRLTVAPLRFGAGIKGKVLDSLAAGLPCVMTPIAAEGVPLLLPLQDLVAEESQALARLILRYHADPVANQAAGEVAAELAASAFSQPGVADAMAAALGQPLTDKSPLQTTNSMPV